MELRTFDKDKGPILAAVLALLALGLGSMFLTWQNISRQRDLVDQHMQLAGGAVVHGVEANLMRVMHSLRRSPDAATKFFPTIHELFKEMTASGEVVFIGIFDEDGHLVASSSDTEGPHDLILPEEIIAALEVEGRWSGPLYYKDKPAIFSALRARSSLSVLCEGARLGFPCPPEKLFPFGPDDGPGEGRGKEGPRPDGQLKDGRSHAPPLDPEMDEGPGAPRKRGLGRSPEVPSMFLMAGLNPQRHLDQFQTYRRAALLQAGYVFGAASLLWVLAFAYLRRRDQALKAARLERFQSKLLDNMPDGLVTLGADGSILSANGSAARLLLAEDAAADPALDAAALLGRHWSEFPFADLAGGADAAGENVT